jgi:hypothetical protein
VTQLALEAPRRSINSTPELAHGTYTLKLLARDNETGHIGTYQKTFVIPNLDRESKRLPTSSVVLSSQRVLPGDALLPARNGLRMTLLARGKRRSVSRPAKRSAAELLLKA